jgi:hypothetical protein
MGESTDDDRKTDPADVVSTFCFGLWTISAFIILLLFIALIATLCATFIPELYQVDWNTAWIERVEKDGTDYVINVNNNVKVLHDDLKVMIGELNTFAALLVSLDTNIANLCNGTTGTCQLANLQPAVKKVQEIFKQIQVPSLDTLSRSIARHSDL